MKKVFILSAFLFIFIVFSDMKMVRAATDSSGTVQELQKKFSDLGGSADDFNQIIQVIHQSQQYNQELQDRIKKVYNPQLAKAMMAEKFDPSLFKDIVEQINKEKALLVEKNLNDMNTLLGSLSKKGREVYAELLYGVKPTQPAVKKPTKPSTPTGAKTGTADSNNINPNDLEESTQGAQDENAILGGDTGNNGANANTRNPDTGNPNSAATTSQNNNTNSYLGGDNNTPTPDNTSPDNNNAANNNATPNNNASGNVQQNPTDNSNNNSCVSAGDNTSSQPSGY